MIKWNKMINDMGTFGVNDMNLNQLYYFRTLAELEHYTKAAEIVLVDGLMQRVSTAEDEFLEMPLDKAGRLLASLARNATYERRVRAELKKKAELAFDQMEAELLKAIKQHPELAGELRNVLGRAREKVVADVGD